MLEGISGHYGGTVEVAIDAVLDEVAVALFPMARAPLGEQTSAVTSVLFDTLGLRTRTGDHRALLTHMALGFGFADPLLIAMLGHELCRRAGIFSRVCVAQEGAWVGLIGDEEFSLVGGVPCTSEPSEIRLACAHECAFLLLSRLRRVGPASTRLCAEGLRHAMRTHGELAHDCPGHACRGWSCARPR